MQETCKGNIDIPIIIEDESLLPFYMTEEAAGADIKAYLQEEMVIQAGASALVPTGIRLAIPDGYEVQIRPRSGLAAKNLVTVLNTPGTIDSDYRGEVKIILINHGKLDFIVTPGMRIAQLIVAPVVRANFILSSELALTKRGAEGFGSTGG